MPKYIPLSRWNDYHAWPSVAGMRHYRYKSRHDPAFAQWKRVFVTVGKRVLVDEDAFFELAERSDDQG